MIGEDEGLKKGKKKKKKKKVNDEYEGVENLDAEAAEAEVHILAEKEKMQKDYLNALEQ